MARAEIISDQISQLGLPKDISILNVGAATFKSSEMLSQFGLVTSLEYDKDCCEFVTKSLNQEIINGSATELEFENDSFDLVCAFDVLEHIENDKLALEEIHRVTKPTGYIFLTVPAYNFLWSPHDVINHHYRRYNSASLRELNSIIEKKSEILKVSFFNSILFPVIYISRKLSNFFHDKSKPIKSDCEKFNGDGVFNSILRNIFSFEKYLLRLTTLPFGVSMLLIEKKKDDN